MLNKVITKGDWIFFAVASIAISVGYTYFTNGKHNFLFAWSAAAVGILVGLFLYAGVKKLVIGK